MGNPFKPTNDKTFVKMEVVSSRNYRLLTLNYLIVNQQFGYTPFLQSQLYE